MSTLGTSDSKRVLYLAQIGIDAEIGYELCISLRKDEIDVDIHQKRGDSSWMPSRPLELLETSKLTIHAQSKRHLLGKLETVAIVSGKDAMEAFWDFKESIIRRTTIDGQVAILSFHFRPSHSLGMMRDAVHTLQTAMTEYRSPGIESTEHIVEFSAKIMDMNLFANLAFRLTSGTSALLAQQRECDEKVADLASIVEGFLPFAYRSLEGILYEEAQLGAVTRRLYDLIGVSATFLIDYVKRPASQHLPESVTQDDNARFKSLSEHFVNLKEEFDISVDVKGLAAIRRSEELSLIEHLDAPEVGNYEENIGCMEGTRVSILYDIVSWAVKPFDGECTPNNPNPSALWVYGPPGLGKTSVANSLCDCLRKTGNLAGSFFCKRNNPDLREPKHIFPILIAGLAQMWGPFRKLALKFLLEEPQIDPHSIHGELLLKTLRLIKANPPRPLVLVIDALDECGQPSSQKQILKRLLEACSLVHWLKVVVTSRPEHDIKAFADRRLMPSLDLATYDLSGDDIRLFIEDSMDLIAGRRSLPPNWPGAERVSEIVRRSRGLFVYVDTLCRLIDGSTPDYLLDQILREECEEASTELERLYSMVVTLRATRRTGQYHSIMKAIVASASYPLSADALAELMDLERSTMNSFMDGLSPFICQVEANHGGIRFRHLSIIEFLTGPACPPQFRVTQGFAHSELAQYCLVMMAKKLSFNICQLETSSLANAEIPDLKDRVEQRIPAALQYSCVHWVDHLCHEFKPVDEEITRLLDGFFVGSQPLYWLEVLSLMGEITVAISQLRQTKTYYANFEERHKRLFKDTLRLVLDFFTPISTSAPHIYISVLPFVTAGLAMWDIASNSFPATIKVRKARVKPRGAPISSEQEHTDSVRCVVYSPNGRRIASGSADCTILIWDVDTGAAVLGPLKGHTGAVYSVAYSPDGQNIVSGSNDFTIRIWSACTGAALGEIIGWGSILSVSYSPSGHHIICGSSDPRIRVWDAITRKPVGEPMAGHRGWINSVAYSPDAQSIVSGGSTIRRWAAKTGAAVGDPLTPQEGYSRTVHSVSYSPDGRNIVSGSADHVVRIWDAQTGVLVKELAGHHGWVSSVAYSPDGQNIVSGAADNTIRIWDAQTGAVVGEPLMGDTGLVWSIAYSPDGKTVLSGSNDKRIRIWNADTSMDENRRTVASNSSNLFKSHACITAFSNQPIPTKMLDSDGWLRDVNGLLLWVPEDCRHRLASPTIMTIPNTRDRRSVRIDFADFRYGASWTKIRGESGGGHS